MPTLIPANLRTTALTPVVNEEPPVPNFLRTLLFSRASEVLLTTEQIKIERLVKTRRLAPFVTRGSASLMVGGITEKAEYVDGPYISINTPLEPWSLIGAPTVMQTELYPSDDAMNRQIRRRIRQTLDVLTQSVDDREEWMIAQLLTGTISYSSIGNDAFTITFPRPAANNVTLSVFWDQAVSGGLVGNGIPTNIKSFQTIIFNAVQRNATDVILGSEATTHFQSSPYLLDQGTKLVSNSLLSFGQNQSLVSLFQTSGARYLGDMFGIRFWSYTRTFINDAGVETAFIRPKYAEVVTANLFDENVFYYGAIADWDNMLRSSGGIRSAGLAPTRRFAKAELLKDPSVYKAMLQTAPLPVARRANAYLSAKVVSG